LLQRVISNNPRLLGKDVVVVDYDTAEPKFTSSRM